MPFGPWAFGLRQRISNNNAIYKNDDNNRFSRDENRRAVSQLLVLADFSEIQQTYFTISNNFHKVAKILSVQGFQFRNSDVNPVIEDLVKNFYFCCVVFE